MIEGKIVTLRPIREADLSLFYEYHQAIGNRGAYFPAGVMPEPVMAQEFQQSGFWKKTEGTLLIIVEEEMAGHIEYFPTVGYLDELEVGYHIYSTAHRGKGVATEALTLLTRYLFDHKKYNRLRLIIHPDNLASKRVAEKCGYQFEGVARGAWFHEGRSQDVEVHALIRSDLAKST